MKSIITITSSQFIQNIKNKDLLFNQLNSHIINEYSKSNNQSINIHILPTHYNNYYIINFNNYYYMGKIQTNELNFTINNFID